MDDILDRLDDNWIGLTIAGVLLTLFVLLGYILYREIDSHSLTEGTVTSKDYSPTWTQVNCNLVGKITVCTPIVYPEAYSITIHGLDPKGLEKSRTVNVDPATFERLRKGDTYKVGK